MGYLKAYYEQLIPLPQAEWDFIASQFNRSVLEKGQLLTKIGTVEIKLTFIETGIIRYFVPKPETELTFNFSFDKEFSCAYDSFLTQTPADYQLQALRKTICWQITYQNLQQIYSQTRVGNYLGRLAAEKLFLVKSKREFYLLNYTAKERYLHLFDQQPQLLQQIPLKYIASYIGVTPQALSRIRRQIC